ncbi:MAG: hypothetical protein J2P21_23595 [Chloracidobacterium sp.]|nr:hypothetical protein [Chloracidobacterium sp.]
MGIRLYIGSAAAKAQGQRLNLCGYRCFTAARRPVKLGQQCNKWEQQRDSGES